jgi:hypothetical protein
VRKVRHTAVAIDMLVNLTGNDNRNTRITTRAEDIVDNVDAHLIRKTL